MPDSTPQDDRQRAARLNELVDQLVASFEGDARTHHLNAAFLPSRARTIQIIELLRQAMFPGFFDEYRITSENVRFHTGEILARIHNLLHDQLRQALRYTLSRSGRDENELAQACDERAQEIALAFLERLPQLRRRLGLDVQAAFDGDPAAESTDETIFCYPGLDAIFIHRVAHEMYDLKVPLLPRIMSEYAHTETGIDIHPGAQIGESFFIDHGTGVVIGETCVIGNNVKVYQGVTLGALSTKGGQEWRGRKRHPTIEDDVTIYGGAIILGGNTVIGQGATIGGAVFITSSIPAGHTVTMKMPELRVSAKKKRRAEKTPPGEPPEALDFQI